jgi:hypothetical protein
VIEPCRISLPQDRTRDELIDELAQVVELATVLLKALTAPQAGQASRPARGRARPVRQAGGR